MNTSATSQATGSSQSITASGETRAQLAKRLISEVIAGTLKQGDRIEVNWGKRGWLPAIFSNYSSADDGEGFERVKATMDNGWACDGSGYHPDCVRRLK
jgi:hypothetical protein